MTEDMKYIYLRNHPMMSSLSEQKLKDAAALAKMRTAYRGEVIGYGEDGYTKVHFLVKGKVKITDNSASENELIKDILVEPDIFGDLSLDGQLSRFEAAEALTANTIIVSFHISDFKRILEENPIMALSYVRKVNAKLQSLENRHADLVFLDHFQRQPATLVFPQDLAVGGIQGLNDGSGRLGIAEPLPYRTARRYRIFTNTLPIPETLNGWQCTASPRQPRARNDHARPWRNAR